jgi:hypothetical protein
VISNRQFFQPDYYVEVAYLNIVIYPAIARINNAEADPYTLTDVVSEEEAVRGAFQSGRKQRDQSQGKQPESTCSPH